MASAAGLYRKALSYLEARSRLRLLRPDELREADEEGISPEDRERILAQIDEVVAGSRMPITDRTFRFKPRKRGGLLPLAVWMAAIAVTVAGVALALELSEEREQAAAAPAGLTTAEGKLLETLRRESREQLAGKDREIAAIRERLAGIDQERARLAAETEAKISAKAQELEASLAASLEEERRKLAERGLSEVEAAKQLADLEATNREAIERELASFRAQADADRAAQEEAIVALRAEYQQSLVQAQTERARLELDASRQQEELEAGYRQQQLALEQDKAAALARLEEIQHQSEREHLVLDQLLSMYQQVRDEVAAGRPEAASEILASLRKYLDDPAVAELPGIARRRAVELFLITSLEEVCRARAGAAAESATAQSLAASAALVTAVAALVEQGDALFQEKDYAQAREIYLSALARIPAVETGYERLEAIEELYTEQGKAQVAAAFAEGSAAYRAADYGRAVERYGRGLELLQGERGTVDTLLAQLQQIGAIRERAFAPARSDKLEADLAAANAARSELAAELAAATSRRDQLAADLASAASRGKQLEADLAAATALGSQLKFELAAGRDRAVGTLAELAQLRQRAAQAAAGAGTPAGSREELLELLNAKLLVQKVLLSEPVVTSYPDLASQLDRYLEALVAEQRSDAQLATLGDLDRLLASLLVRRGAAVPDDLLARYGGSGQQELLLGILEKLKALIE